jgi:ubiquinone/menaquinone biosynthesis C-methylase UbiE
MENTNQGMSLRDLAWNQLRALPAFRSLVRAMESRLLSQLGTLSDPALDIGAGDGHFAQSVFRGIDVGMDSDRLILQEARKRGVYSNLCVSSATDMPFRNSFFSL